MKDVYKDLELELQAYKDKITELENKVSILKQVIIDNDLEEDIPEDIDTVTVEERICIDGINHIAELVKTHQYDDKDIKNFDTLFKIFRALRGKSLPSEGKAKKTNPQEIKNLLKIVNEEKK